MALVKKGNTKDDAFNIAVMVQHLERIYSNKSGDEYKMHGDITKSPSYDLIQRTVADLDTIKGLSKTDIKDLKDMFNILHRPNFKSVITKWMGDKNRKYIIVVATFTCAYRILIGELSSIYTSTEATENGFVYKPGKIIKKRDMKKFIRNFNTRIDNELNKVIRSSTKAVKPGVDFKIEYFLQEGFLGSAGRFAQVVANVLGAIGPYFEEIGAWCRMLFPDVSAINPISWMSSILSNSYDSKVDKYHEYAALYLKTKEAYDEYMKLPEYQRNKKIESKYIKNMDTYNIKMKNAYAKIEHYDQRSIKEAVDAAKKMETKSDSTPSSTSSSKEETTTRSEETSSSKDDTGYSDSNGSSNDDDPFEF
jgi:hypothetical protein